jgi:hypothetical protein
MLKSPMVGQPLVAKASWFAVIHLTKTVSRYLHAPDCLLVCVTTSGSMTTGATQLVRDNNQMLQLTYASLGILSNYDFC